MDVPPEAIKLAQIFGPFLTVIGFWMLLFTRYLETMWKKVRDHSGPFYTWGAIDFFVGLVIITNYCQWTFSPFVFLTLLGWGLIVTGFFTLFFPTPTARLLLSNRHFLQVRGVFPLVWGLVLSAAGYVQ